MTITLERPTPTEVETTTTDLVPVTYHYALREDWLVDAVKALSVIFAEVGETLPATRVSVGWPGGLGNKSNVIGQAWVKYAAFDDVAQVFISPVLDYGPRVLDVLAHELIHVIDENQSGHQGRFVKIARAIGLEGKPTATIAGPLLEARLQEIAQRLGAYPHARLRTAEELFFLVPTGPGRKGPRLKADGPPKQSTRMHKVECSEGSGYKVRMTRQWLDSYGPPLCPCHREPMIEV